jgi:hypothetical protein
MPASHCGDSADDLAQILDRDRLDAVADCLTLASKYSARDAIAPRMRKLFLENNADG